MSMLLKQVCKQHTTLSMKDIEVLCTINYSLQQYANLNQANMFIDCLTEEPNKMVVVAEATPHDGKSLYKYPVAGEFAYKSFEPAVFQALKRGEHVLSHRAITQEGKIVEQNVVPIIGEKDKVIAALIMEKDISDKVQDEDKIEALSEATEKLSKIMFNSFQTEPIVTEAIEEALFYLDEKNIIKYFNTSAASLVNNFNIESCKVGLSITSILPFTKKILDSSEALSVREKQVNGNFFKLKKIDLNQNNPEDGTLLFIRDLTELKKKERELILKSVAIKEIHHRVKNNLQTIASLVRLQMRRGIPPDSQKYFKDTLSRILSISSVYEITLAENHTDNVDVDLLIKKICRMLLDTEEHHTKQIKCLFDVENLQTSSDTAVTIALIVNELILNCIKHAFKQNDTKLINISLNTKNNKVSLAIKDNGTGYVPSSHSSFGLDIVKMMVEFNLNGKFSIESNHAGTLATVIFPLEGSETDAR